ncbi:MAG: hypothetical protein A3H44_13710 [Gammaproteobacteria bacterium RIFCSPLOWO2_02_FULL_57_10]|nr:MAG: hypothetical protein A3H44_13710 [Gammaproteobacteria bacterium RIFCSPLOWO2_02_FULL_57_10]
MTLTPSLWERALLAISLPLILVPTTAFADTYVEASITDYGDGYRGKNLYVEHVLRGDYSLSVSAYDDPEYASIYVGIARMIGDFQLGLGLGEAETGGESSFGYNPTLWYQRDAWEGFAEYEYLQDDSEGYYYRGYVHCDLTDNIYAGVYSERWVGNGPLLGVKFADNNLELRAYVAKPMFNETDVDMVANLIVSFEF